MNTHPLFQNSDLSYSIMNNDSNALYNMLQTQAIQPSYPHMGIFRTLQVIPTDLTTLDFSLKKTDSILPVLNKDPTGSLSNLKPRIVVVAKTSKANHTWENVKFATNKDIVLPNAHFATSKTIIPLKCNKPL